jgi:iron complex outermembrane receptor protein
VQDTPLADIERIEVIRGPGASLWGANAVNGVINIITKSARDTTGGHLSAGVGTYEKNFGSFRYGHQFDDSTAGRVWASGFNRGSMENTLGTHNDDDWSMARTGFRLDRDAQRGNALTVLGNAYSGSLHNNLNLPSLAPPYVATDHSRTAVSGFNLLGRWKKSLSLSSELSLQAYFDHVYRRETFLTEERDTFDLEMQHRLALTDSHSINWGMGYRYSQDRYGTGTPLVSFRDASIGRQLFSLFVQDDIELIANTLNLTLGSKFQHNDFTGFEGQPSLRLLWRVNDRHTLWGAISRAVRTPTRGDDNAVFLTSIIPPNFLQYQGQPNPVPILAYADGNPRMATEQMIAYEFGYRFQQHSGLFLDAALFFNDYDRLRGLDFNNPSVDYPGLSRLAIAHGSIQNSMTAQSLGAEWLAHWEPAPWWKMDLTYTFVKTHFRSLLGPLNFSSEKGMTPQQQVSFRSGFDIGRNVDLDFWLRYVDRLPLHGTATGDSPAVLAYVTLDTRLAWRPYSGLELSLVGQNLLSGGHAEMEQELFSPPRTKIPRAMYVKLDWHF